MSSLVNTDGGCTLKVTSTFIFEGKEKGAFGLEGTVSGTTDGKKGEEGVSLEKEVVNCKFCRDGCVAHVF